MAAVILVCPLDSSSTHSPKQRGEGSPKNRAVTARVICAGKLSQKLGGERDYGLASSLFPFLTNKSKNERKAGRKSQTLFDRDLLKRFKVGGVKEKMKKREDGD